MMCIRQASAIKGGNFDTPGHCAYGETSDKKVSHITQLDD